MKIYVIQKSLRDNHVIAEMEFERETKEEILDIVKTFSKESKNYEATYIQFRFED